MKKTGKFCRMILVSFVFSIFTVITISASVYVSSSGDDNNPGTEAQPVQTLQKAVSLAKNYETVYLERGSVFRESVTSGNIHFKACGDEQLPLPVVSGGIKIENWELWDKSETIYKAKVDQPVQHLYVNGQIQTIARYPNTGWLKVGEGSTSDILIDNNLTAHPENREDYWKGATLRWRKWSWWYEIRKVTGYNASTGAIYSEHTIDSPPESERVGIGAGYYLDGLLTELDSPGEWVYVPEEQTVYWWPEEGILPSNTSVEGTVRSTGIVSGGTGVQIEGIAFEYQNETALKVKGKTSIINCSFKNISQRGVVLTWGAGGSLISNSEFTDILQGAVWWNENPENGESSKITGNTFSRVGNIPGYGGSGIMKDIAISLINHNNRMVVEYNRISDVGYAGIWMRDGKATVRRNVLTRCMTTLNDGGALYVLGDDNVIRENIILDTEGDLESSHPWRCLGQGIWPEFVGPPFENNKVVDNTVIGSGSRGLMLLNRLNDEIEGNVLVDNESGGIQLGWQSGNGTQTDRNMNFKNNLIVNSYTTEPRWYNVKVFGISYVDGVSYGQITGTTIVCQSADLAIGKRVLEEGYGYKSMPVADFKSLSWGDQNMEVVVEKQLGKTIFPLVIINDTKQPAGLLLPEGGYFYDIHGNRIFQVDSIKPFHSEVVLRMAGERPETNRTLISRADFGTVTFSRQTEFHRKGLKLFPNPAKNKITVELPEEDMMLQLYSVSGKIIREIKTSGRKTELQLSGLHNGGYFLRAVGRNGVFTEKFVKR